MSGSQAPFHSYSALRIHIHQSWAFSYWALVSFRIICAVMPSRPELTLQVRTLWPTWMGWSLRLLPVLTFHSPTPFFQSHPPTAVMQSPHYRPQLSEHFLWMRLQHFRSLEGLFESQSLVRILPILQSSGEPCENVISNPCRKRSCSPYLSPHRFSFNHENTIPPLWLWLLHLMILI